MYDDMVLEKILTLVAPPDRAESPEHRRAGTVAEHLHCKNGLVDGTDGLRNKKFVNAAVSSMVWGVVIRYWFLR